MTAPDGLGPEEDHFDNLENIIMRLHNLQWLMESWPEAMGNSTEASAVYCVANNVERAHEELSDWLRAAHVEAKATGPVAVT